MKGKLNVMDLFSGAGGMSEGFNQAGYNVVFGSEYIQAFSKTFQTNNKKAKAICADVREVSVDEIKEMLGDIKIDVLVGGPPCQGFSMAGRRDKSDPRNSLFMEYVRILEGFQCPWFVMENVPGILTMKTANNENVIDIIGNEFKRIGYRFEYRKLLAANYGVPQKRTRVVFIGTNTNQEITYPIPTHGKIPSKDLLGNEIKKWVGVGSVLSKEDEVPKNYFHSPKMIKGFIKRKEMNRLKGNGFGWQILKPDQPSYTISARYWKDGSDAIVKYTDDKIRMLTERECARIQTFPDSYIFEGSKRDVYTQIGNAVPPLLAKNIALELKKKF